MREKFLFKAFLFFLFYTYIDAANVAIFSKSPSGCGFQGYTPGKKPKKVGAVNTAQATLDQGDAANFAKGKMAAYLNPLSKAAALQMHSKNLANTIFENFKDTAPKLAPALGVFGAVAGIINDAPTPMDIINAANLAMSELSADVNEKITSLQGYVDVSITNKLTEMLSLQYEKQFTMWLACIDEWDMSEVNECQRDRIFELEGMKSDFARHWALLFKDKPPAADAVTVGQYTCEFRPSDGVGGSEKFHNGVNGAEACMRKCIAEKANDPSINGITTRRVNTGCWCESNMDAMDRSNEVATTYKTCFLVDKDIYAASYSCQMRSGDGISKEEKRIAGEEYKCWENKKCKGHLLSDRLWRGPKKDFEALCNSKEDCSGFVYRESIEAGRLCNKEFQYPGELEHDNVILCQKPEKKEEDTVQLAAISGNECIKKCMEEKKKNKRINGVTTTKNGQAGCWCQIGMVDIDESADGGMQSCFLYKKANDLDWEKIRELEAYMLPARNAFNLIIMVLKPLIEVYKEDDSCQGKFYYNKYLHKMKENVEFYEKYFSLAVAQIIKYWSGVHPVAHRPCGQLDDIRCSGPVTHKDYEMYNIDVFTFDIGFHTGNIYSCSCTIDGLQQNCQVPMFVRVDGHEDPGDYSYISDSGKGEVYGVRKFMKKRVRELRMELENDAKDKIEEYWYHNLFSFGDLWHDAWVVGNATKKTLCPRGTYREPTDGPSKGNKKREERYNKKHHL